MAQRKMTANRGAADTRSQIKRIIEREFKRWEETPTMSFEVFKENIIAKIDRMAIRASAKPGGLGRKKK